MRCASSLLLTFSAILVGSGASLHCAAAPPEETTAIRQLVIDASRVRARPGGVAPAIADYPAETAVDSIVYLLRNDPEFATGLVRSTAYKCLVDLGAASFDSGCAQLIACLEERSNRAICASALWTASKQNEPKVIRALGTVLQHVSEPGEASTVIPVLRALSHYDLRAMEYCDDVLGTFAGASHSLKVRAAAARTSGRICPRSRSLTTMLDAKDASEHLWPFAALSPGAGADLAKDDVTRERMKNFVLKILQSSDLDSRVAAFDSLLLLFDGNFATEGPHGTFVVNPELVEMLKYVAEHDPDTRLRQRARSILGTLDQRLQKVIRKRQDGN